MFISDIKRRQHKEFVMIRIVEWVGTLSHDFPKSSSVAAVVSIPCSAVAYLADIVEKPAIAIGALIIAILSFSTPFASLLCRYLAKRWHLRDRDQ